jgi:hypothetical protein
MAKSLNEPVMLVPGIMALRESEKLDEWGGLAGTKMDGV